MIRKYGEIREDGMVFVFKKKDAQTESIGLLKSIL